MPPRASYSFTIHPADEAMPTSPLKYPVVAIVDQDKGRSVTNDAASVIADLAAQGIDPDGYRFTYRDTSGTWDELLVGPGTQFGGFAPLRERELTAALQKLDARYRDLGEDMAAVANEADANDASAEIVALGPRDSKTGIQVQVASGALSRNAVGDAEPRATPKCLSHPLLRPNDAAREGTESFFAHAPWSLHHAYDRAIVAFLGYLVKHGTGERQGRCRLKVHAGSDWAWCRRGTFEVLIGIAGTMLVDGGAPRRSPSAARALV